MTRQAIALECEPLEIQGRRFALTVLVVDPSELDKLFKGGFGKGPRDGSQLISNHCKLHVSELASR